MLCAFVSKCQRALSLARCERVTAVAEAARRAPAPEGPAPDIPRGPCAVAGRRRLRVPPVRQGPLVAVELLFSSTFSAAAGDTELMRGWKVAQKIALLALSNVAERGIDSRGHALAMGPSHCDYMNISRQNNGRAYDITCCWNAGASACDELEHIITVPQ